MRNKKRITVKPRIFPVITRILLFLCLSCAAIYLGLLAGNTLDEFGVERLQGMSTQYFEKIINHSFPMIDSVYNSGNISSSISGEIKDLVKGIFSFDINDPVSIFGAHSSMFYSYYIHHYVVERNTDEANNQAGNDADPRIVSQPTAPSGETDPVVLPEAASSITYDGETDDKDSQTPEEISSGKITIQNETKYKVDIDSLINQPLKFSFNKSNSKILIFHTHTTESYIKNLNQLNQASVPTRSTDPRYSVVRVGDELAQNLKSKYGIQVIHNGTIHDSPDYNSSYVNSLQTVNKILKGNPSVKIVIDLHRDAIGNGKKLRRVTKVNNKNAAQIMFVMATGEAGLSHPQWRENLKLALKLQAQLNKISPGLARPIYLSKYRYNQHVSTGALLVEIGGDGNLMEECLESTKYLAQAINEVVGK